MTTFFQATAMILITIIMYLGAKWVQHRFNNNPF